ncbi:MAG TPA: thrombospondin type 3 repeat-containing protein [Candidatus Binatia bacterium]|jgi:hypothetical protein|nr:thrombospondin type 3 repeat-containing protein [Candidatus Binatia bacterium]
MSFKPSHLIVILLPFAFSTISATVRYVDVNSTNAVPPYTDWTTAATNIQDAVDAAIAGDQVLVTNGLYQSGGRTAYDNPNYPYAHTTNRVVVDKAVVVQSVNGPGVTIIQGYRDQIITNGPVRCVFLASNATLVGFTLTDGTTMNSGGGVWCESSRSSVSNCVLTGNLGWQEGGGSFRGALNNCAFHDNTGFLGGGAGESILGGCTLSNNSTISDGYGGASYYGTLTNCVLANNSGNYGGGSCYDTLRNCTLSNNSAYYGGGSFCSILNNSRLTSNSAVYGGGSWNGTLNYCTISGNSALNLGGGAAESALNNCLVISNSARYGGSGSYGGGASGGALKDCTVSANYASVHGSGLYTCEATNCVVYYNSGEDYYSANLVYCCSASAYGFANITNAPLFVDQGGGDYRLQSNSPCINSGNNAFVSATNDLDGNPRIVGGTVDIGAYEFQTPASVISYAWLQQYGLPTDGSADLIDTDGDGMNNWKEWICGTDPTNPLSVLKMLSPSNSVSGLTVPWQSVSGINYYLQRSSNLAALPAFLTLQSNIVGQAGTTIYTDTNATGVGPFFYRVGVQ